LQLSDSFILFKSVGIVIAAITIPTLLNNMNESDLKSRWRKAYSVASQAWKTAASENVYTTNGGWSCTWPSGEFMDGSTGPDGRIDALKSKLNVIKSCVDENGCWPLTYESSVIIDNGGNYPPKKYSWVTSDGMCWASPWYPGDQSHILVDTNCDKGPNLVGKDIFSMLLGIDGVVYFALGDKSTDGKPVSSGNVCPYSEANYIVNGRKVDFTEWLKD